MKFKKIVAFGDSWTFGEGSYLLSNEEKNCILNSPEKNMYGVSKQYFDTCSPGSWVAQLAKMYGCDYEIYAVPGCSNETIMNNIHRYITEDVVDKDTLIIVMWSSKFRDRIFALPSYEEDATSDRWMFRSEDMVLNKELWEKFIDNTKSSLYLKFKKKFITEMLMNNFGLLYDVL